LTAPRFADHRLHLAELRAAALRAVDPASAVRRSLSPGDFAEAERIFVVGGGKAGIAMAQAAAEILGDRLTSGLVSVPAVPSQTPAGITFVAGGHPTPTGGSLAAGRAARAAALLESKGYTVMAFCGLSDYKGKSGKPKIFPKVKPGR